MSKKTKTIKKDFQSPLDQLFHEFDQHRSILPQSRLEEIKKHEQIAAKKGSRIKSCTIGLPELLLSYWQDAFLREYGNTAAFEDLPKQDLLFADVELGVASLQATIDTEPMLGTEIWVVPCWRNKNNIANTIAPLWIPAIIIAGRLEPSTLCPLPWLAPASFDMQNTMGTLFESIEHYDKQLLDHFFDAHNVLVQENWASYFAACMQVCHDLLRPQARQVLEQEYVLETAWVIVRAPDLIFLNAPLVQRYASSDILDFQEQKTTHAPHALLSIKGQYPDTAFLTAQQKNVLIQLLALQANTIQAIHTPQYLDKTRFLQSYIASIWTASALDSVLCADKQPPVIVWVALKPPLVGVDLEPILSDIYGTYECCEIEKQLKAHYALFIEGMQLIEDYTALHAQHSTDRKHVDNANEIEALILEKQMLDHRLEIKAERYMKKYAFWQKQHASWSWKKLVSWLPHEKNRKHKKLTELLLDKIRKTKVARTKIHNQLVDMSQIMVLQNGINNRFAIWFQTHMHTQMDPVIEKNTDSIMQHFGAKLFIWASRYFSAHSKSDVSPVMVLSMEEALARYNFVHSQDADASVLPSIDYLIIDDSDKISASRVLPLLAHAKRALFLGGGSGMPARALASPLYDSALLRAYKLAHTDEDLEDLSYQGVHAQASAFCVAQIASALKESQIDGTGQCTLSVSEHRYTPMQAVFADHVACHNLLNSSINSAHAADTVSPVLRYVHIKGEKESIGLHSHNVLEAQGIIDWIVENTHVAHSGSCAIVTLFEGQRNYLIKEMHQASVAVPVYLIEELAHLQYDIILFSPTYTQADAKPYLLESQPGLLNAVFDSARESVIIFADMGIFDPHSYTPAGQIAKLLFQPVNRLQLTPRIGMDRKIIGIKAHKEVLWSALQEAQSSLTIISSHISENILKEFLEQFCLKRETMPQSSPIACTLYMSNNPIEGMNWKSTHILNILSQLSEKGVEVAMISGLHTNALWVDSHYYIEGTQPWLYLNNEMGCSIAYSAQHSLALINRVSGQLKNQMPQIITEYIMSEKLMIQAIRGMKDILPDMTPVWHKIEALILTTLKQYGYQEIRLPMMEQTHLFKRAIGDVTDIVEKEMYSFQDRNGDSLSLRPEGTASCVRAAIEHGLLYNQTQKLWYYGPMFRHERPQKGRYRQFYQLGVEQFGNCDPMLDAEQVLLAHRLWEQCGIAGMLRLEINSLGTQENRQRYKAVLVNYLETHRDKLDEDSLRRLTTNPLRILDSKNPDMQELIKNAPQLLAYLDEPAQLHFDQFKAHLDAAGIAYTVNPRLVRGLDYYCHTVYEWVTDELGAQGTVCAGGRYDGLVELLGGKATPAVGFAVGIERLISLMALHQTLSALELDAYLIVLGDAPQKQALKLAETLRNQMPDLKLLMGTSGSSKAQFKKADKSGAKFAFIIGDTELENNSVTIKFLREEKEQITLNIQDFSEFIK